MSMKKLGLMASLAAVTLASGLAFAQPDDRTLDPRVRAKIESEWRKHAGPSGVVSREAFMQAMEGHWHTFEKRHGHGKVKPEDMPRLMMFLSGQDASPP